MGPGGENGPSDARGDGEVDDLDDRSPGREQTSTSRKPDRVHSVVGVVLRVCVRALGSCVLTQGLLMPRTEVSFWRPPLPPNNR